VLVGWAARRYGWRWGMWAPGAVGFTVGILLLLGVRDSPVSVGYKPVEPVENTKKVRRTDRNRIQVPVLAVRTSLP